MPSITIGEPERATQKRIVTLLRDELNYRCCPLKIARLGAMGKLPEALRPDKIIHAIKGTFGATVTPNLGDLFLMPDVDNDAAAVFTVVRHKFSP